MIYIVSETFITINDGLVRYYLISGINEKIHQDSDGFIICSNIYDTFIKAHTVLIRYLK